MLLPILSLMFLFPASRKPMLSSTSMKADKDRRAQMVEFKDKKSSDSFLAKTSSQKTTIVVISILLVVLLLSAVIAVSFHLALKKTNSTRLVEVNLEEGETLAYEVNQQIEIQGNDVQKATIRAIVGIEVLNKTSEEYWFLMKFNLSYLDGNVDLGDVRKRNPYFLVHLLIDSNRTDNESSQSFEVYGHRHTNEEFLRLVDNILDQLLPNVQHDLYEDVDGVKSGSMDPEDSPLLPGSVKMHRKANTSGENLVFIENHFNREDFNNLTTEIDLDVKYSDHAVINKSTGMVTESHSNFAQQLNFGEPIHNKSGFNVSKMKVTLTSYISLVEFIYLDLNMESGRVRSHSFVKLVVPKTRVTVSVKEKPSRIPSKLPLNVSSPSRSRRAAGYVPWREAGTNYLDFNHRFTLFQKKMIGINVKGEGTVWSRRLWQNNVEIGVSSGLTIGSWKLPDLFYTTYQRSEVEHGHLWPIKRHWRVRKTISMQVYFLRVGVEFSLGFQVSIQVHFPWYQNSANPVKLTMKIDPSAEATASIQGFVSAYIIRGGVYGDGTLVRVGLPVTLSYREDRYRSQWCTSLSVRLTALELSAGLFYQWRSWWGWGWGRRRTLYEFGRWAAIRRSWNELERCS